jgi:hypothetical protein
MAGKKSIGVNDQGYRVGENHARARSSDELVESARALHEEGVGYKTLAWFFGVPVRTIRDWISFRRRNQFYANWKEAKK